METKITYNIAGQNNFLSQAEYSFHIPEALQKYEDSFVLAEKVEIVFEDEINRDPNIPRPNILEVLDKGKKIKLTIIESRFHLGKGKVSDPPSPESFLSGFRNYMVNTVIREDKERFEQLNRK
jgi:hypothetical protein